MKKTYSISGINDKEWNVVRSIRGILLSIYDFEQALSNLVQICNFSKVEIFRPTGLMRQKQEAFPLVGIPEVDQAIVIVRVSRIYAPSFTCCIYRDETERKYLFSFFEMSGLQGKPFEFIEQSCKVSQAVLDAVRTV